VQESIRQATYAVVGMTCASCARQVEEALRSTPGIDEVVVNFATRKASLTYRPDQVTVEGLDRAVREAGYELVTGAASRSSCSVCLTVRFTSRENGSFSLH
jgi:Cu+-exporting ATPase